MNRRDLLKLSGLGGVSWLTLLADRLALAAEQTPLDEPAQSLIFLWMAGGPSQLETFDPHPGKNIAGGTKAIKTSASGIQLAEGLEQMAERMHDVSLVRSLVSKEGDHQRGTYLVQTGYRPDPTVIHPSLGAICCHELPEGRTDIPRHISILPYRWPERGGLLGDQYDAFKVGDPRSPVSDVAPRVGADRFERRLKDLQVLESAFAHGRAPLTDATLHRDTVARARTMMSSEQLKAFDVSEEPAELKAAYGDTAFGRGCLAARRLIEKGVRCVEVTLTGWDTHAKNHELSTALKRELDPAFATLINDLKLRGLFDKTIVLCGGEFGRTPEINPLGGRDHWPHGFSMALAGGRLRGGLALGETDPEGGKEVRDPFEVSDIHATVLKALGIDPTREIMSAVGRPIKLSEGHPIGKLVTV